MIARTSRGTALVETALSVGVALLLVLGAAQMALIGYTQVSADGAAFVSAHARAANPNANGVTTATSVFNQFEAGDFTTPSPGPLLDPSVVKKNVGGFALVPGVASTYSVTGKDVEYAPANVSSTPAPYQFSIGASLLNYCDTSNKPCAPSALQIYLAQNLGTGNGNGVNGQFGEWRCHQKYFARVAQAFPGSYPASNGYKNAVKGTDLDVSTQSSDENAIYSWDPPGGKKCT